MAKDKTFENAMKRLNEIYELMSDENLPLEKAVKLYSEASELIKICKDQIDDARLQLTELFS